MKSIVIGDKKFKTQTDCEKYTRQILTELGITNSVMNKNTEYFIYLKLLCERHPNYNEKLLKMVDFKINSSRLNPRGLELNIINNDNTYTEISWKTCVSGTTKPIKKIFVSALRQSITHQIMQFKETTDLSYCKKCNCCLKDKRNNVDHHTIQFIQLVDDFMELNKIQMPIEYNKKNITFEIVFKEEDKWIGELFSSYHLQHATLRILCEPCNLTRKKYKK